MHYRHDIDGLRAIAVLAVILNHLFLNIFPNGYLGVDVFFVISGYVITASLAQRSEARFWDFLLSFYARRIKRLLPALLVCCLITAVAIALVNPDPEESLKTGFTAVFGASNIFLFFRASDYFSRAVTLNPFTHTWSLGVEEQFYLVFPLVFFLLFCWGRGARSPAFGVGAILALLATSFAAWVWFTPIDPIATFYIVAFRGWQLLLGVLVFLVLGRRAFRPNRPAMAQSVSIGITLALIAVLIAPGLDGKIILQIAATVLAGAVIAWGCVTRAAQQMAGNPILLHPALRYTGKISYSLYLWHWPLIVLAKWTIGLGGLVEVALVASLIVVASWASYTFVERPLRNAAWTRALVPTLATGVLTMAMVGGVIFGMARGMGPDLFLGRAPDLVAMGPRTLIAPFRAADGSTWDGLRCVLSDDAQVGKVIPIEGCTLGRFDSAKRRILVVGNSVSASFVQAFDATAVLEGAYAVTITASWGASAVAGVPNATRWQRANDHYWNTVVPELSRTLRPGDILFIVADLSRFSPPAPGPDTVDLLAAYQKGIEALAASLAQRDLRLAVLGPLPFARDFNCEPILAIPQWYAPNGGPCDFMTRDETKLRAHALTEYLVGLDQQGILHLVDVFNLFCPAERCTYLAADGTVLYRDGAAHASVEAANLSEAAIFERLSRIP